MRTLGVGILALVFLGGCGPLGGIFAFLEATDDNSVLPEPLVVVQSGPSAISDTADAAFTFSINRTDLAFEGRLVRIGEAPPPFVRITNPFVLNGLADGEYEFNVRVNAGTKISEATHRWRVDTTPPETPTLPRITSATDTELFLAWTQSADLGSGVVGYEIHYSLDVPPATPAAGDFTGVAAVVATLTQDSPARVGNVTLASLASLQRCKRYFVGISALDAAGNRSAIAVAASRRTGCGGNGRFAVVRDVSVAPLSPIGLAAADFDGDGTVDLVAGGESSGVLMRGAGDGTFAVTTSPNLAALRANMTPIDLNGDGAIDVVGGRELIVNMGGGTFFEADPVGPFSRHAVGDFNRDGVPDIARINTDTIQTSDIPRLDIALQRLALREGVPIGRGEGFVDRGSGGSFEVGEITDLETADFNADGRVDVAVMQDGRIAVLLGTGDAALLDGTLHFVGTGDTPRAMVPVDLDRDGKPDLAVATGENPASLRIFRGNGDGTFLPPLVLQTGTNPSTVVAGDFNADAVPDLAVVCEGSSDVHIYLGQRGAGNAFGVWTRDAIYPVGAGAVDLTVADFNSDGILDLATANAGASSVTILMGQGAAGRGNGAMVLLDGVELATGDRPRDMITADFNADAIPDLAVVAEPDPELVDDETGQPAPSIVIFPGRGVNGQADGTFGPGEVLRMAGIDDTNVLRPGTGGQAAFPAASISMSLVAADFNGDRALDLVAFKGGGADQFPRLDVNVFDGDVAFGRGTGTFGVRRSVGTDPENPAFGEVGPSGLRAADLDRDGFPDLIAVSDLRFDGNFPEFFTEHVLSVRLGAGDGTFPVQLTSGPPTSGTIRPEASQGGAVRRRHLALGDCNADGVLDAVSVDEFFGELHVWLGNQASPGRGDGTFDEQPVIPIGAAPSYVVLADVNRDRILDVVVTQQTAGSIRVLLGNGVNGIGDGTFTSGQEIATGAGAMHISLGDFNGDNEIDMAVANRVAGTISILLGNGTGTFTVDQSYAVGTNPIATVVIDANADNVPDVAVVDETDRKVRIFLGVNELE